MNEIQKRWVENLAALKSASMRIAHREDFSPDSIRGFQKSKQDFLDFIEGYKSVVGTYPGANEVVATFNKLMTVVNLNTEDTDVLKGSILIFLKALDVAIKEVYNMAVEQAEKKSTTVNISNSEGIQVGDHNFQNIQNITNNISELIKQIDLSNNTPEQKQVAKSKIEELVNNPTVAAILGGAISGLLSSLS